MRLHILDDPNLMQQLKEVSLLPTDPANAVHRSRSQVQPELANAARSDPARFSQLLRQIRQRQADAELERQREMDRLEAEPPDPGTKQRTEEEAKQWQVVLENLEYAMEYTPEFFGKVTML